MREKVFAGVSGSHLKVNDLEGNPIEIAAVVVWRVVETFEACFHLVVLCGERAAQPVINTGTIYQ